jgi:hypothetical protein
MKMWKATIDALIVNNTGDKIIHTQTPVCVPADSRGDALIVMLDMGQAMARSTNLSTAGMGLYFRVVNVEETDRTIA